MLSVSPSCQVRSKRSPQTPPLSRPRSPLRKLHTSMLEGPGSHPPGLPLLGLWLMVGWSSATGAAAWAPLMPVPDLVEPGPQPVRGTPGPTIGFRERTLRVPAPVVGRGQVSADGPAADAEDPAHLVQVEDRSFGHGPDLPSSSRRCR